jgi:hypothetical protein
MMDHRASRRSLAVLGPCLVLVATIARSATPDPAADPGSWSRATDGELTRVQAPAAPTRPVLPTPTPPLPPPVTPPAGRPGGGPGPGPSLRPGATTAPVRPDFSELARQTFDDSGPAGGPPPGPSLTSLERFPLVGVPQMLGDQAPIFGPPRLRATPSGPSVVRLPWVRGYKMADNQSPWPIDRFFVAFYFYNDLNFGNDRPGALLRDVRVWREFFGLEKTFLDRRASIGLRLPLDTISAEGRGPGVGGTSTALGDLTVFTKYALWQAPARGDVFSLGFAVTPPTGPAGFAGADFAVARKPTYLQPFVGYMKTFGPRWYAQGFSGINVPTDSHVVTMLYNDFGVGYYLHRAQDPDALLTSVVPSMEVHVNTPLNHRGGFSDVRDPGATIDAVNLTFGLSAILRRRTVLSVGYVTPVTGPHPFEYEIVALLNVYFGATRRAGPPSAPPSFGG